MTGRPRSEPWAGTPERGSIGVMRFMVWVILRLGRPVARALLPAIVLYFLVVAGRARRASRAWLARVLGRPPRWRELHRHLHAFASVLVDRVYFLAGRFDAFDIRVHGADALEAALARGGCVLLGAHLGSFEALRACGVHLGRCEVVMMMDEANARKIGRVLADLNPQAASAIINAGDPASAIRAKERIDRGALIGILGDRARVSGRRVPVPFVGTPAPFPADPMALAAALRAPIFLGVGLYRGGNRYDVHFEPLAPDGIGPAARRAGALDATLQAYAARLEHYARIDPFNWFNFYDFWAEGESDAR